MELVFKKTVKERLDEMLYEARKNGKGIELIKLTDVEFTLLKFELGTVDSPKGSFSAMYQGILIEVI